MAMIPPNESYLIALRKLLVERFNDSELRTLCFDLNVDYECLSGPGKADKARELVDYCRRYDQLEELVRVGKKQRPDVAWSSLWKENQKPLQQALSNPSSNLRSTGERVKSRTEWKPWSDHPVIVGVMALASLLAIAVFLTGKSDLPSLLHGDIQPPTSTIAVTAITPIPKKIDMENPAKKSISPSFGEISFCVEDNFNRQTQRCEGPQSVFSAPVQTIYISWSYSNVYKGMIFHQEWYWNGVPDRFHSSSKENPQDWDGENWQLDGTTEFTYISSETIYLPRGEHQIKLYIEGKLQQIGNFSIEQCPTYRVTGVPPNDTLSVRSAPGVESQKVGEIPPYGTGIEITGATRRVNDSIWAPVKYRWITGWVNSSYITTE